MTKLHRGMATTAIDTLRYARKLKDAGVPSDQAEAMADAIASELADHLATRADLEKVDLDLKGSIRLHHWMLAFTLAFLVAMTLKLFFP